LVGLAHASPKLVMLALAAVVGLSQSVTIAPP
jgi:hypothetical protein